jgi:hypothetical protein
VIGTIVAFFATNYWSYVSGQDSQRSLLIETLSRYREFYDEVQENHLVACNNDRQLQGLYLSQYKSMLPVINEEIHPPYDNPCPLIKPPRPPSNLKAIVREIIE